MRLRIGSRSYTGASIDLRGRSDDDTGSRSREIDSSDPAASTPTTATSVRTVPATRLAARIATAVDSDDGVSLRADRLEAEVPVELDCPEPGAAHAPLRSHPADGPARSVLAAAARACGRTASVDDAIAERREALGELELPDVNLDAARKRLAAATGEEERLKERVAALRGKLEAHRDLDADEGTVREELADATTALSEAETERIAAEQALDQAVERARDARDARDRRLRLEDEIANLERDARRELADEIYPAVRDELEAIPGATPALAGDSPTSLAGDVASVAFAAVRVASLDAPVVLGPSVDRFGSATAARDVLGCPVVRV